MGAVERRGSHSVTIAVHRALALRYGHGDNNFKTRSMDPNLHQQKGIEHLNKVLRYAPMVAAGGKATVHLTYEDWHVVADTLFRMNTPREVLPEAISDYRIGPQHRSIEIDTPALRITVEMF